MLAYIDSSVWITRFEGIAFYQDKIENSFTYTRARRLGLMYF